MCVIVILFWLSPLISSRNLDKVFTYKHMALMSYRIRSHVKVSMILTKDDHLFIQNYIRSLLNISLRPILIVLTACHWLESAYCLCLYDSL